MQSLRVVRDKIDEIEKKLKDSAGFEEEVLRQQKKNNEAIIEQSLRLEEHSEKFKNVDDKINAASSSVKQGKGGPLAGHPKDLPKWANSTPFSQWKFVFITGLDGIVPGLQKLLEWVEESTHEAAKANFADKSAELGIEDTYAQIASTLHYHLTQKCIDNPGALEIIKEGKNDGIKSWKLLCEEYSRITGADLLTRHEQCLEVKAPSNLRELPSLLRRWEEELTLLKISRGRVLFRTRCHQTEHIGSAINWEQDRHNSPIPGVVQQRGIYGIWESS